MDRGKLELKGRAVEMGGGCGLEVGGWSVVL